MLLPPSKAWWIWRSKTCCTSVWLYTLMISSSLVKTLTSTYSTCGWFLNGYVRKNSWQSGRSVNLVKLTSSILAMLLRIEWFILTLTKSARCKLGRNHTTSRKCSNFWAWQIIMLNTSVILLILLDRSLPWWHLSGNGFSVPTRMWCLTSYGSSYVTHQCYGCLTYHVVL